MSNDTPLAFQVVILGADDRPICNGLILDGLRVLIFAHVVAHATTGDPNGVPSSDLNVMVPTIPLRCGGPLVARLREGASRA